MILQIDIKEWCLLQDALSGIAHLHPLDEVYEMTQKLNRVLTEQTVDIKEDTDDNQKTVSI